MYLENIWILWYVSIQAAQRKQRTFCFPTRTVASDILEVGFTPQDKVVGIKLWGRRHLPNNFVPGFLSSLTSTQREFSIFHSLSDSFWRSVCWPNTETLPFGCKIRSKQGVGCVLYPRRSAPAPAALDRASIASMGARGSSLGIAPSWRSNDFQASWVALQPLFSVEMSWNP